jgi:hypothetical protein
MLLMSSMGVEMMPVKVKTLNINTNTDYKCNSWLDHWEHWGGANVPVFVVKNFVTT